MTYSCGRGVDEVDGVGGEGSVRAPTVVCTVPESPSVGTSYCEGDVGVSSLCSVYTSLFRDLGLRVLHLSWEVC